MFLFRPLLRAHVELTFLCTLKCNILKASQELSNLQFTDNTITNHFYC